MKNILICSVLMLPALPVAAQNAFDETGGKQPVAAPVVALEEAWQKLPSYKLGDSFAAPNTIAREVAKVPRPAGQRDALVKKLTAVLDNAAATPDAKKFACRQLMILGTAQAVPSLKTLLLGADADLAFYARYALERNEAPEALAALREALTKTKGATLAGVIDSLGARRDAASAAAIAKFAGDADATVATAALKALGKIGGADAERALAAARKTEGPLRNTALNASLLLAAAQPNGAAIFQEIYASNAPATTRMAAWRGLAKAQNAGGARLVIDAFKTNDLALQNAATSVLGETPQLAGPVAAEMAKLAPAAQVLVLGALATQSNPALREPLEAALKSPDENVRVAALNALANSGTAQSVAPVAALAAGGTMREKTAAQNSLERLRGAGVNEALSAQMEKSDAPQRAVLARALGARRAPGSNAALLKLSADADENVRVAALESLALIAASNDVAPLLDWQNKVASKGGRELTALEKTLVAAAQSGANKATQADAVLAALNGAEPPRKASLLRVAGAIGGAPANAALVAALKEGDATVRDAAVRTLAASLDQSIAATLLDLAQNAERPAHKVLAFRGYVRLAGDTALKAAPRLAMYQAALGVAPQGEKAQVLTGIGTIANLDALKLAAPALDDESVREEAAAAVSAIAGKMTGGNVSEAAKEPLRSALKKLLEVSKNEASRKQAAESLKKLG